MSTPSLTRSPARSSDGPSASRRRRFADLGVTTKILGAILVTGLVGIVVGVLGLQSLGDTAARTQAMYAGDVRGIHQVQEMRLQLMTIRFFGVRRVTATTPEQLRTYTEGRTAAYDALVAATERYVAEASPSPAQQQVVEDAVQCGACRPRRGR